MAITGITQCPACMDGYHVTPQGEQVSCGVCHGTTFVTPGQFCYCGQSLSYVLGKIAYCGDPKCWDELAKLATTQ